MIKILVKEGEDMNFNIQFQICGLLLVFMIIVILLRQKSLHLKNERIFVVMTFTIFLCLLLDLSSIIAINYMDYMPQIITDIICKAYLFSIMCVAHVLHIYTLTNIFKSDSKKIKQKIYFYAFIFVVGLLILCTQKINYHFTENEIYTYGLCVTATYAVSLIYLISSFYHIMKYKSIMNKNRWFAIMFLIISWTVTAIIQFFNNELLLVGYSMALAVVYMYLRLENPNDNLDKMTGIFNNYAFNTYISFLKDSKQKYSIITVSMSDFKFIIDTFGYKNSLQLVKDISDYLLSIKKGRIFRNSEYEFSMVFNSVEHDELEPVMEQIKEKLAQPWIICDTSINLSAVICLIPDCTLLDDREEVGELLRYYINKYTMSHNVNTVVINEEEIEKKNETDEIEMALRHALREEAIEVYYQPVYSVKIKRYTYVEAVTRIYDKNGNPFSPDVFVPIAEQNGMILKLGSIVFEKVCKFIKQNDLKSVGIDRVSINLSIIQCMQNNLADELISTMKLYDIPANMINLEISETTAINSTNTLMDTMIRLSNQGISFSLDDYGRGYANISYIIDMPLGIIKFDREFIHSYFENEKVKVALRFAIDMIKHFGLQIHIDGVESKESFEEILKLDVDYVQGSYLSNELKPSEVLDKICSELTL